MADQSQGFDVVVERSFDDETPLYQTDAERMLGARLTLVPHEVRFAYNNPGDPVGDQTLTVTNQVTQLLVPDLALSCVIQVQANPIRWTVSATAPAAAVGFHADALGIIQLTGMPSMRSFRAFRESAADATLFVTYFD